MANHYLPTRANQLQPGDVVVDPYTSRPRLVTRVIPLGNWQKVYFEGDKDATLLWGTDDVDKRITDEEYEALSAPGVSDGNAI